MQNSDCDHLPCILVVDDDALVARGLTRALARENRVTSALGGAAALTLVLSDSPRFDVILCDLVMPGMSGIEFYEELARVAPHMAERVIFISGDVSSRKVIGFLATIENVRLEKPFDIEVLRAAVREGSRRVTHDDSDPLPFATAS